MTGEGRAGGYIGMSMRSEDLKYNDMHGQYDSPTSSACLIPSLLQGGCNGHRITGSILDLGLGHHGLSIAL